MRWTLLPSRPASTDVSPQPDCPALCRKPPPAGERRHPR
jgi:hypothetical protein